jgi:hypothetical protein
MSHNSNEGGERSTAIGLMAGQRDRLERLQLLA